MLLEVGMRIYTEGCFPKRLYRYAITRLTPTQAIVECTPGNGKPFEIRFPKEIGDGRWFSAKGDVGGWDKSLYSIETPELKEKYERQILEFKYTRIKVEALSREQLEAILVIAHKGATDA